MVQPTGYKRAALNDTFYLIYNSLTELRCSQWNFNLIFFKELKYEATAQVFLQTFEEKTFLKENQLLPIKPW